MLTVIRSAAVALVTLLPTLASAVPEGPTYPSPAWAARETANYAKVLEAPTEQAFNPAFLRRLSTQSLLNTTDLLLRNTLDPSWVLAYTPTLAAAIQALGDGTPVQRTLDNVYALLRNDPSASLRLPLNVPIALPVCASYALQCAGDPYRWPSADPFYTLEANVEPVVFYDSGCARLSGRVWKPRGVLPGRRLPGIVIQNGSVQAPETAYWWMAQALVRAGYTVLSFDPRGQGRSDFATPDLQQGTNINPSVFWTGLVDAIDFMRSRPGKPYPNAARCGRSYPTRTASINPFHAVLDLDRLGIVGHSLGAVGVSIVQGYGAAGADPWPGKLDSRNPVDVAVAWDGLISPADGTPGGAGGALFDRLPELLTRSIVDRLITRDEPRWQPRVPTMGQSSEYGLAPLPFTAPPEPESHKIGFKAWQLAGVPSYELSIRGSTHYEWSQIPTFPTTSWCPSTAGGRCNGGFGRPMAEHYTLAWLDRWLKRSGETGYATADARLLDDSSWRDRSSFYYRSARSFSTRGGVAKVCEDIRAGC
ncbi:alpha/beta hydrolase family protein [Nevskia ramosa]|uniref:alpha/beta hydrolase family protein n=1 Tax=Nevskia ramosa TaxID=64002 RepID=UPI00235704B4|nr:hypothetical protein [Nevskia ramosa]